MAFVGTEGRTPPEALAEMNRDWPAYAEEMEPRGGLRLGRELSLPETGVVTVRVRDGETLVTDGPFAETKGYLGGIDVFEGADLDEAIEVEALSPGARFLPFEICPLPDSFRVGVRTGAFGAGDDSGGIPYLLIVWIGTGSEAALDDQVVTQECGLANPGGGARREPSSGPGSRDRGARLLFRSGRGRKR